MAAILLLRRLNHGTDGLHEMIEGANQTRPASRCPQRHICPSGRPLQRCGNERHRSTGNAHGLYWPEKGAAHHEQAGASAYFATRVLVRSLGWAGSGITGPACIVAA